MSRRTDRARSALQDAEAQVAAWERRAEELTSDLATADATIGADALASGNLEAAAAKVSGLRDQLAVARQTVTAAEAQRDAAQCAVWRAEAEDKRGRGRPSRSRRLEAPSEDASTARSAERA